MTADTFARLRAVILDATGGGPVLVEPEARLADVIPDSFDRFEVILGVEEEFSIEVTDADAETLTTVADFVALIDRKREGSA